MNVNEKITEVITKKLEAGTVPWVMPWNTVPPRNFYTGQYYSGINTLLLDPGEYLTFCQLQMLNTKREEKAYIKKGTKGQIIIKCVELNNDKTKDKAADEEKDDNKDDPESTIFIRKYYTVFNICDIDGIESNIPKNEYKPLNTAEDIVKNYKNGPTIKEGSMAFYIPKKDEIRMPDKGYFKSIEHYYSTLFHEIIHSTGSENRLSRLKSFNKGSADYAKEELTAEIGAAFLCNRAGIDFHIDNTAAYIENWLKVLNEDKSLIAKAAAKAERAVKYITGELELEKTA
jgi:antirestriction protein ArdC